MHVVTVPVSLEERTFEQLIAGAAAAGEARLLLDAHHVRWVDPYGMVGLLVLGQTVAQAGEQPVLRLPDNPDVLSYLGRMGFFEHAEPHFELHGAVGRAPPDARSDVLLEITAVNSHGDVHDVVELVNQRGMAILTTQLNYPQREAFQFSVILSEVCQNIIEHAETGGWVASQTYTWRKRLGRKVVVIAVMDLGIGFRASLGGTHAVRFPGGWDDVTALDAAFMHGKTRFHDPGRGQGLQQIRRQVARWRGRVSVRSGTARIADVPDWDDAPALERGLSLLPGAQIGIVLPARTGTDAGTRSPFDR